MRFAPTFTIALLALLAVGCGLEERDDFLVGRECQPQAETPCDDRQACLPHLIERGVLKEFRCRDVASFEPIEGRPAPLAFCAEAKDLLCPGDLVCNADLKFRGR